MVAQYCVPYVLRESSTLNHIQSRLHGLDHWFRVWKNALLIAGGDSNVDFEVVAMYALFHDSMRLNDAEDQSHGMRGYRLWERCKLFTPHIEEIVTDGQEEMLLEACAEHNLGLLTTDPTIAVCWDADRLDLPRKGIWPDVHLMSTHEARAMCVNRVIR